MKWIRRYGPISVCCVILYQNNLSTTLEVYKVCPWNAIIHYIRILTGGYMMLIGPE